MYVKHCNLDMHYMSARKPNFGIGYTENVTVVKKQNAQDNGTVSLNGTLHALQYRVLIHTINRFSSDR
jgi:hypothetical protein